MPATAYKRHVEACNEVLGKVLAEKVNDRSTVISLLKEGYERRGIGPIRGWAAKDLYDKEMATLYTIGKFGLGLTSGDYAFLNDIFSKEILYEKVYNDVLSGADPVNSIKQHLGEVNQENVFRIIRLGLTLVVLGFEAEGKLLKVFQELRGHLSVFERGFASFLRFYTALRTAEAISIGLIKNRYEKEAFKLSYCVKLGCFKDAPPDKLISLISRSVFGLDMRQLLGRRREPLLNTFRGLPSKFTYTAHQVGDEG
ncbi:MAG: DUF2192 domain-containing protein [Candidatus Nezhaarchaeales archaeon]